MMFRCTDSNCGLIWDYDEIYPSSITYDQESPEIQLQKMKDQIYNPPLCPECGKQMLTNYCLCKKEAISVLPNKPKRPKIKVVRCRYCKEPLDNYSRCKSCNYKTTLMAKYFVSLM